VAGEEEHTAMSMYHEVIEALSLLVQTLDKLGIVYYIGGSVSIAISRRSFQQGKRLYRSRAADVP
jgi:hypothetical protein